ncbi:MAG: putative Ig domain-containing protein [Reinekea sp.]
MKFLGSKEESMACALRRYEVTDSGNWLPQEKYVQTVPTFNKQCYVVPSGTAKVYEEGDEASGSVYIAPLFHRVREAIAQGSSYVAPAAVSWHKTNNCLGCHIQTQTLLGLESSIGKADVDEDIAAYLLNEIINSQLSDGAIRRSHPEYAKNQTAFALWALSFVPDRQATFDTRAKALSFLWERKLSANGTTYWTNDHSSGWLNNADAMTALVALGASRYIQDAQEQDDLTAEQQSVVDHYTGVLDNIADYVLNRSHLNEDGNLPNALRLAALGELRNVLLLVSPDNSKLDAIIADMQDLDVLLRARQETDGGWNLKASGNTSDPLTSAWVGLALNYLHPPLNDQAVLDNIEYLLSSQQPDGTWITSSKLFTTRLATTSLVMSYLPVALEHLGNPDVSAGHILLTEQNDGTNTLSAVIQNRGLSDVTVPVLVNFYNGAPENNHLLGQVALDQIASNQSLKPSITIADAELTDDVYVTLTVAAEASECDITNNQSIAALVRVRATDPGQLFDTQVYTLNVDDVNQAPVITSEAPTELQGGQSFDYQIISTDDDVADAHSYRLIQGPDGLYLDPHSGRFTSAPGGIEPGNYSVTVQVTDLRGESVEQTFTLVVYANLPPQITSAPVIHGNNDSGYHYDIEATDPNEGDVLQYTYNTGPDGLAVNADSGVVGWNDIAVSLVEGKTDTNLFCLGEPAKIIGQFEPVVMWSKDQFDIGGTEILGPVLVGQMTDDNNDGVINSLDDTDVVMLGTEGSRTFIAVLDGATGTPHWINFDYNNNGIGSAAIADLDKDGKPEIYVLSYRRQTLMVIDNKGNLIRETETGLPYFSGSSGVRDGVTIADLDEDGNAEIIVGRNVLNGDGTIRWKGTKDYGGDTTYALIPVVADINLDGQQEVIAGRTIYSSTGEVLSHNTSIPSDGFNAIGNFNDDDYAEIVTVADSPGLVYPVRHVPDLPRVH